MVFDFSGIDLKPGEVVLFYADGKREVMGRRKTMPSALQDKPQPTKAAKEVSKVVVKTVTNKNKAKKELSVTKDILTFESRRGEGMGVSHGAIATDGTKLCIVCGKPFTSRRSDARYCKPACRQIAHRKQLVGVLS